MTPRVLLVEDDLLLTELIEMLLSIEGFDVVHAANGAEALELLKEGVFDLVVLDLMMPVMDGLRFLQELPETSTERPPVLVFSASTAAGVSERALEAGATAVARKPIDQEEFVGLVRSLLRPRSGEGG